MTAEFLKLMNYLFITFFVCVHIVLSYLCDIFNLIFLVISFHLVSCIMYNMFLTNYQKINV